MLRYFIRNLDIAICETDASAARYADWREVTRAEVRKVWRHRDRMQLLRLTAAAIKARRRAQVEQVLAEQREVGHWQ